MKIAQVCHRYYPTIGGIQTHVKEISQRLVKKGFEVEVLTTDPTKKFLKKEVSNGIVIKRFNSWAPNGAFYFSREFKRYLLENSDDFDVVHAHNYNAFPAFYAALAKKKNRLIFTPHYHPAGSTFFRNIFHIPYKFLGKKIFKKADKTVCVSDYEKALLKKRFNIYDDNIVVIPNGLNLEEFKYFQRNEKDNSVIFYVGRLEKYKGVQYLIKALPKLKNKFILEIVGTGSYKKFLVKLSEELGVENKVRFFQDLPRKELIQKYIDADLFVLLSKYEAYGISVAEALAARTPCIVAKTSALEEWVDNLNCFGVDYPINLDGLSSLISEVIGTEVIGVKLYDWDDVVSKLIEIYES